MGVGWSGCDVSLGAGLGAAGEVVCVFASTGIFIFLLVCFFCVQKT